MARSILKGSAILVPIAVVGLLLLKALGASEDLLAVFVLLIFAACGIVPFFIDEELKRPPSA